MSLLPPELAKLSVPARIDLARLLLDSVSDDLVPPLTEPQMADLQKRLAEYELNPDDAQPWEEVLAELEAEDDSAPVDSATREGGHQRGKAMV
jgi:putative addiction module component (TIGR02574 family)